MTYEEVLEYFYNQLPMFHRIGAAAYKADMNISKSLDEYFNFPHKKYKTIHIAGTNGKGSVSHFLASILQSAGYKTGLYTSPHLKDYRERIKINGEMISKDYVVKFVEKHQKYFKTLQASFFEITTALAFDYFANQQVDIAVIETGMGGRLDSTNVITPILSVITNISYDHMQFLGDTLEKIAEEKAGIIKKGIPVVIGETHARTRGVFLDKAEKNDAQLYFADLNYSANTSFYTSDNKQSFNVNKNGKLFFENLKSDLMGTYQQKNIATVLECLDVLKTKRINIDNANLYEGILNTAQKTGLMGRWQTLGKNPLIICDTGHNEAGISFVVRQISQTPHKILHFVLGAVNDKDIDKMLRLLPKEAVYYFTKASIPRALNENELKELAENHNLKGNSYSTVKEAFETAKKNAGTEDLIFVGGSTFVVAEVV